MPENNPIQEVLTVRVQTDQFKRGLDDLRKIWASFVSDVGAGNVGKVIGAGMFSGVSEQLKNIQETLVVVAKTITDNIDILVNSTNSGLSKVDEQLDKIEQKQRKRNEQRVRDFKESIAQAAESAEAFDTYAPVRSNTESVQKAEVLARQADAALEARRIRNQQEAVEAAHIQAIAENAKRSNSGGGIFGNLGEELATLTRVHVEWAAIGAIIGTIGNALAAPFKALEEGSEYLKRTQADAVLLEAALLSSVKYSDDLAENFRLTQEATVAATKGLQQIVVNNPGLKLQDVQSSFKVIAEGLGGKGGVDTLRQMLDLTEKFSLAVRAAGVDVQVTRRLSTELRKAFSGDVPQESALASFFKVTHTELESMVQLGIKNNDLYGRFEEKFEAIAKQAKDSKDSVEAIEGSAKLLSDQLAGTFATGSVDAYKDELKRLLEIMQSPEFQNHVTQAGALAEFWSRIKADVTSYITFLASLHEKNDYTDEKNPTRFKFGQNSSPYKNFDPKQYGKDELSQFLADKAKGGDILDKTLTSISDNPDNSKKKRSPYDVSQISTHLSEYRNQLENIKSSFKDVKEQEDELVASGKENKGAESYGVNRAYDQSYHSTELAKQQALAKAKEDHNAALADIDSKAVENRAKEIKVSDEDIAKQRKEANVRYNNSVLEIEREFNTTLDGLRSQRTSAEKAALNEIQAIRKANFEASIEMAKKEAEYAVAVAENKAKLIGAGFSSGLYNQQDVLDSKRQALADRQTALNTESDTVWSTYVQENLNTTPNSIGRTQANNKYDSSIASIKLQQLAIDQAIKDLDIETYDVELKLNQSRVEFYTKINQLATEYKQAQESQRFTSQQLIDRSVGKKTDSTQHYAIVENIRQSQIDYKNSLIEYNNVLIESNKNEAQRLQLLAANAQLLSEIKNLQMGRVSDINAQLGEVDADGGSPTIRNIIKRHKLLKARDASMDPGTTNQINQDLQGLNPSFLEEFKNNLYSLVPGLQNAVEAFGAAKDMGDKLGEAQAAVEGFTDVMQAAQNAIAVYQQGKQNGGTIGGVGALMSQYGGLVPVAGPFIQAAGAALTMIGGIFASKAKHIVDNITNQFNYTMQQLSNGEYGINQTLQAVEQERQQAISQLSGVKGGQDQLSKILPQLDQQIQSLQAQQRQAAADFANSYNVLALSLEQGNTVGQQIYQNWINVNKQVYDYVNATGDATTATKFLSMTLQQLQITSQQQLDAGEKQAIEDAITLNQELQQRTQLIESLNEQVFALQNQDSTERTQAGSVSRAQQVQQLQRQAHQQLQDLNFQITQQEAVVSAEGKVFDLSGDIYALHQKDTELVLDSLQLQISGYQQLKDIIASISQGSDGLFSSTLDYLNPTRNSVVNGPQLILQPGSINVTIYTGDNINVNDVTADTISSALQQSARSGSSIA